MNSQTPTISWCQKLRALPALVKSWSWKRVFAGLLRLLAPTIIAIPVVLLLQHFGKIDNNGFYVAWTTTSVALTGWFNSFYREQKRYDDIDRHDRSYGAVDEVMKLLRTIREELQDPRENTESGMPPLSPPSNQGVAGP